MKPILYAIVAVSLYVGYLKHTSGDTAIAICAIALAGFALGWAHMEEK